MTELDTGKTLFDLINEGRAVVEDKAKAAKEAQREANLAKDEYLKAMRAMLVGKKIRVTGFTSHAEYMVQDGFEYHNHSEHLKDAEAQMTSLFYDDSRFGENFQFKAYMTVVGRGKYIVQLSSLRELKFIEEPAVSV